VQRLAVIAKLKPDSEGRAAELIERGPPFSPKAVGFVKHSVYLAGDHVVFLFEGGKLDDLLRTVVADPAGSAAFREWERILDGMPRVAREAYSWERGEDWPESWGDSTRTCLQVGEPEQHGCDRSGIEKRRPLSR
jgi:hypothetical protein